LCKVSDITFAELVETPLAPTKKMGRPKGSKNKPKALEDNPIWSNSLGASSETIPITPNRWIHLLLKSEAVPEGLPMVINKWVINGVSKLPSGGASVVADVGGAQPMILTTLTPYEEVAKQVESASEF